MTFRKILVPVEFAGASDKAVDLALELATKFEAEIVLCHSYEIPVYTYPGAPLVPVVDITPSLQRSAELGLAAESKKVEARWPRTRAVLRCGSPWREILEVAKENQCDLIVMGTRGRKGMAHALLGSITEKIVRLSNVPVMTVHSR